MSKYIVYKEEVEEFFEKGDCEECPFCDSHFSANKLDFEYDCCIGYQSDKCPLEIVEE